MLSAPSVFEIVSSSVSSSDEVLPPVLLRLVGVLPTVCGAIVADENATR